MANDLIYPSTVVDEDEKKKEKSLYGDYTEGQERRNEPYLDYTGEGTVQDLQKDLKEGGWFKGIYPENAPDDLIIDNKYGKYTVEAERRRKAAQQPTETVPEIETPEVPPLPEVETEDIPDVVKSGKLTYDDWLKQSGLGDIPELKGYTDESREKRALDQQKYYNLAKALRVTMQGVSGEKGSYMSKFDPDTTTPRVQAELSRIRDAQDSDERRVSLANWQNKIRNSELYNAYSTREDAQDRADARQRERASSREGIEQGRIDARVKEGDVDFERQKELIGLRGDQNASLLRIRAEISDNKAETKEEIAKLTEDQQTAINEYLNMYSGLGYSTQDSQLKMLNDRERMLFQKHTEGKQLKPEEINELYNTLNKKFKIGSDPVVTEGNTEQPSTEQSDYSQYKRK